MSLPDTLIDEVRAAKAAQGCRFAVDPAARARLAHRQWRLRPPRGPRARHVYRQRRDALIAALARHLPGLTIEGAAAGLHVLLRLPDGVDDVAIEAAAAQRGIGVNPLSPMSRPSTPKRGFLLGYSRLSEERIDTAVSALAVCLADAGVAARPSVAARGVGATTLAAPSAQASSS